MKKQFVVGLLVSALFLYLALKDIDWQLFGDAFRQVNYWWLIPAVFFTMLGHYTRAHRWKFMLAPIKLIPQGPLWSATAIAFMVNNLFPARLGEFVRAYAIGKSEGISKSAAFATIVYERVVDVFMLIALLWLTLFYIDGPDWMEKSAVVLVAFNVALMVALVVMLRAPQRFVALIAALVRPLPQRIRERVVHLTESFVEGLAVLRDASHLWPITVYSVVVWGSAVLGIYFALLSLDMQLPYFTSVLLVVIISLGSMIPSAPAFVGTMQYACILGLAVYGVQKAEALAYSTVYHATQFFPITLAGLYYAAKAQIGLSEISQRGDTNATAEK